MSSGEKAYFPHVDGLRALAVLAVVAYHLHAAWLPGGFAGVDVFFVISGYVVSASLAQARSQAPAAGGLAGAWRFALGFYARRVLRILPALLACLLATSLAATLLVPSAWLSAANERTGLWAFVGLSNVVLALRQDTYYAPRAEFNPFIHTWSLGVEEQFYLVFPWLFLGWLGAGRGRRRTAWAMAALALASLACAAWLGGRNPNAAFYLIFSRFWELAVGVLLFLCTAQRPWPLERWPLAARWAAQAAGLALVAAGLWRARLDAFPFPWALLPVAGVALLIVSLKGERAATPVMALLSSRAAVGVGRLSYSLYLWHWPVFVLMRWTLGLEGAAARALALALAAGCALASFAWVEQPLRRSPRLQRWPRGAVAAAGICASVLGALLAQRMFEAQPRLSLSATRDVAAWQPRATELPPGQAPCALAGESTPLAGGSRQHYAPARCAAQAQQPGARALFVLGDSHAGAYETLLARLVQETGREVWLYSKGGCPYLNLLEPDSQSAPDCRAFVEASRADVLARAQAGDLVFLPSLRVRRLGDQWALFPPDAVHEAMAGEAARQARAQAVSEGQADIAAFGAHGLRVVLEAPKPVFRAPAYRCADWFNQRNPICAPGLEMERDALLAYRAPAMEALQTLAQDAPGVSLWDPFPLLCPGHSCTALDGGEPLFFDGDHLSALGNLRLYPAFARCVAAASACGPVAGRPGGGS